MGWPQSDTGELESGAVPDGRPTGGGGHPGYGREEAGGMVVGVEERGHAGQWRMWTGVEGKEQNHDT